MISAGVFEAPFPRRVELINGEIREMTPIGSFHEEVVTRLGTWSARNLSEDQARVRVQCSIWLPEQETSPEPDIAWVVPRDYSQQRPTPPDVFLLIEVAETSLAYDRGEKADLYAAAGIAEYWVVDLISRVVEVRREPLAGHYRSLKTFSGSEEVRSLSFPGMVLSPAMLW